MRHRQRLELKHRLPIGSSLVFIVCLRAFHMLVSFWLAGHKPRAHNCPPPLHSLLCAATLCGAPCMPLLLSCDVLARVLFVIQSRIGKQAGRVAAGVLNTLQK